MDIVLLAIVFLVVGFVLIVKATEWMYAMSGPQRAFDMDVIRFLDDARARGLGYHEAMDEWSVRTAFAEMRSDATKAVLADPENWKQAMDAAVQRAFDRLADSGRRDLMPHLGSMLKGTTFRDIVYPDAAREIEKVPVPMGPPPTIYQHAALRIVKR